MGETSGGRDITLVLDAWLEVEGIGPLDAPERGEATRTQVAAALAWWLGEQARGAFGCEVAVQWIAERLAVALKSDPVVGQIAPAPGLAGGQKALEAPESGDGGLERGARFLADVPPAVPNQIKERQL